MDDLSLSLVRISHPHDGSPVGVGFLATEKHILTPAHVVSAALELPTGGMDNQALPTALVSLSTLSDPGLHFSARVTRWWPNEREDLAILEFETAPPKTLQAARLVISDEFWGHSFRVYGFPRGYDDGIWVSGKMEGTLRSRGWVQLEASRQRAFSTAGAFSGSPIWDDQLAGVVGMLVARDSEGTAAFFQTIASIVTIWPELKSSIKTQQGSKYNVQVGQIQGTVIGENAQIIVQTAFGKDQGRGLAAVDVDPQGDVVVIPSGGSKVVEKIPQQAAYERIAAAADTNRRQIEQIYGQGRNQAEQWSRFSLIAAALGFLVVLGGGVAILTGNTPAGLVTAAAGIIPEVAAALFFQQAREANKRVDDIREKLLEAEGIHRAIELSLTTDEETQNRLKEAIITKILGLPPKEKLG